jgi:tetratricopeptide (TPR) repeat protein/predicted Ser/Thr protein kinase
MVDDPKKELSDALTAGVGAGVKQSSAGAGSSGGLPPQSSLLAPGVLLGERYEVLELIGQGGMGAVYRARDLQLDRIIALKTMRPDLSEHPEVLRRFKQELILARQVSHRNVIRIYDLGEAAGMKFITMEYVEGEDLRCYLTRQRKLSVREAVDIVLQICRGLEAAHAEGVIHRDLKPQNVLRQSNGRIQVMDFGLARSSESEGLTVTGAMLGTVEYMSPEQAIGKGVSPQSDLFSVGLIFYELLTGELPYKADSAVASLVLRTQHRAKPPREIDPEIPDTVSDVVRKCLEPDMAERYQSASEIIRDLVSWNSGRPTAIDFRSTAVPAAAPKPKRAKWPYIGAAAVVIAALVAGGVYYRRPKQAPLSASKAVTLLVADFDNKTGDGVFDGTLEPSFALAMEGASNVNTFSRTDAHKIAAQIQPGTQKMDSSLAQLVAAREGIDVVVGGSVERSGSGFKVTARAYDPVAGRELSTEEQRVADKSEVLKGLNQLAVSLRKDLGDRSITSTEAVAAETYTASSIDAAHEYALGQQAKQAGNYDEAIHHYQEAIRLDPQMGRAYAGLAVVYGNQGDRHKAEESYKLALERLDRMSEREKFRTRGGYYLITRNADKALDEMEALVRQYPADSAGVANLALAYFYRREMQHALEYGRKSVEISPKNVEQRNNLGLYAMYAGEFDRAIDEQKQVLNLNPSFALAYVGTALPQLAKGEPEQAHATYAKLAALSEKQASTAALGEADALLYEGRYKEGIAWLQEKIKTDQGKGYKASAARKLIALADAYLATGRMNDAVAAADAALKANDEDAVEIAAARVFAAAGQAPRANSLADKLAAHLDADPQAYARLIRGDIELARHKYADAVRLLMESKQLSDTWLVHYELGLAYLGANAFTEANSEFETCLRRKGEATAMFLDESPTLRKLPPVYYYLGRSQEALHSPGAANSFATYAAIMKSADPNPLLEDARKRAAAR